MREIGEILFYLAETEQAAGNEARALDTAQHAADMLRASGDLAAVAKADELVAALGGGRADSPGSPPESSSETAMAAARHNAKPKRRARATVGAART